MQYADEIAVCENIHCKEVETDRGMDVEWYADVTYYSPDEYKVKQDEKIKLSEYRAIVTSFEITLDLVWGNKQSRIEKLARSYAELIVSGEKTLDNIPAVPANLKTRVEHLLTEKKYEN